MSEYEGLVTKVWEKFLMEDCVRFPIAQDGTNTSSESPRLWLDGQNAPADEWERSSYETDELFLQAITALQRAMRVALTVPVLVDFPMSNPEVPMTPDQARALPYMQRLTHYCGLIETTAKELRSIARIAPATAATDSSKDQESSESSPQRKYLRSDDPEPPFNSVVLDDSGDAWQRDWEHWNCAMHDNGEYSNWTWAKLTRMYSRVELIYEGGTR